jgi:hypothetical protein
MKKLIPFLLVAVGLIGSASAATVIPDLSISPLPTSFTSSASGGSGYGYTGFFSGKQSLIIGVEGGATCIQEANGTLATPH